jgi:type III secretion protein F
MAITPTSNGLTFDYINNSVYRVVQQREAALRDQISALGSNPSSADLLNLQQQIQQWTMMNQVQSTLVKEVSDALKGIIQKAA